MIGGFGVPGFGVPGFSIPMIAGLGVPELMVIFLILVLLFGASKLPQIGRGIGEGIRNFKSGVKSDDDHRIEDPDRKIG